MTTYNELIAQIRTLTEQAEELRQKEIATAIADIKKLMETHGITVVDLGGSKGKSKAAAATKSTVPVKYRGPKGETWTGRGRTPTWLADAEAAGKKRESFAV